MLQPEYYHFSYSFGLWWYINSLPLNASHTFLMGTGSLIFWINCTAFGASNINTDSTPLYKSFACYKKAGSKNPYKLERIFFISFFSSDWLHFSSKHLNTSYQWTKAKSNHSQHCHPVYECSAASSQPSPHKIVLRGQISQKSTKSILYQRMTAGIL